MLNGLLARTVQQPSVVSARIPEHTFMLQPSVCRSCGRALVSRAELLNARRSTLFGETALPQRVQRRQGRRPARATGPVAMVNVDFTPSLVLGLGMIGGGLGLYQVRLSRPWISRDYDVVISSISILTGGILVFQGWRLDPLLLFGQLLTAGTAAAFAFESLRLRDRIAEEQKPAEEEVFRAQQQPQQQQQWGLPPPPTADFNQWSGSGEADGVRRWQPTEPPPASWQEEVYQPEYEQPPWASPATDSASASFDDRQPVGSYEDQAGQQSGHRSSSWKTESYDSVEDWL